MKSVRWWEVGALALLGHLAFYAFTGIALWGPVNSEARFGALCVMHILVLGGGFVSLINRTTYEGQL